MFFKFLDFKSLNPNDATFTHPASNQILVTSSPPYNLLHWFSFSFLIRYHIEILTKHSGDFDNSVKFLWPLNYGNCAYPMLSNRISDSVFCLTPRSFLSYAFGSGVCSTPYVHPNNNINNSNNISNNRHTNLFTFNNIYHGDLLMQ